MNLSKPLRGDIPDCLPHAPPLSTRYFFAWATVTAVILAVTTLALQSPVPRSKSSPVPAMKAPATLLRSALAVSVLGWVVCGALLIGRHAIRRNLWKLEPGEWIVLFLANLGLLWSVIMLVQQSPWFFVLIHDHGSRHEFWEWLEIAKIAISWQSALVLLGVAFVQQHRPLWRAMFALGGVEMALFYLPLLPHRLIEGIYAPFPRIAAFVACVLMGTILALFIAALIRDHRHHATRHWLHWSGVGIAALLLLWRFGIAVLTLFAALVIPYLWRWLGGGGTIRG